VELVDRSDGKPEGMLVFGRDTGSLYGLHPADPRLLGETATPAFATNLGVSPPAPPFTGDTAGRAPHDRAH
jgi:hypothetical protein